MTMTMMLMMMMIEKARGREGAPKKPNQKSIGTRFGLEPGSRLRGWEGGRRRKQLDFVTTKICRFSSYLQTIYFLQTIFHCGVYVCVCVYEE